ncbi:serine hydrolase domain-containing protein [Parafrankia discariae]|uniref:serine hydrolase domain-containing protein n=1 Tax=Parafrankia discariae TaxID=365528 RepID=UPI001E2C9FA8|nr:serine hydrolase domain-containing protein [Parafrankia discariae]
MMYRRSFLGGSALAVLATGCGRSGPRSAGPGSGAGGASAAPADVDLSALDEHLATLAAAGRFSGVVQVAHLGRTVLAAAYGMADRAAGAANTPRTLFCIGSLNKMFTGVAVAQLAGRRLLSFDDPVGKFLDGFPPETASAVRLRHLLTHTSGLGDIFDDEGGGAEVTAENHTIDALLARIRREPPRFAPGSGYSYSNAGFVVLGAIVERVTGQAYADYTREHVFTPAGMRDTVVRSRRPVDVGGMAHPYALVGPDGRPLDLGPAPAAELPPGTETRDLGDQVQGASPAGGAVSTAADLVGFADALLRHRLLSRELTDLVLAGKVQLTQPAPAPGDAGTGGSGPGAAPAPAPGGGPVRTGPVEPPRYGYGFLDRRINGTRVVGHNGGTPGYEADLAIYPDSGYAVAILANQDQVLLSASARAEELLT